MVQFLRLLARPGSASLAFAAVKLALSLWQTLFMYPAAAFAGAWLMPPGKGQIIASTAFSSSTRAFNGQGRLIPVPSYRKFELGTYIEYGVADWLTLTASPAYDRIEAAPPAVPYNGVGESEAAAKVGLYRSDEVSVAVQFGLRSPGASINNSSGPFNPRRPGAIELRALVGRNIDVLSLPGFVEAQAAYRIYAGQPGEWRLDLTLGARPLPDLLLLLQTFCSISDLYGRAPAPPWPSVSFATTSWAKVQPSFVYDLSPQWSLQVGGFLTLAGMNAGRELGPLAAVWYRF